MTRKRPADERRSPCGYNGCQMRQITTVTMASVCPSLVDVRLLRVDAGCVPFQRLLTGDEGGLGRLAPVGAEYVAVADPGEPVLQLDQVDLVLFQFRVGEVLRDVLLLHLRQEVLAPVDDLLV